MLRGWILALTLAAALLVAPAGQAALCNGSAKVDLDVGAAASVPRIKGEQLSTFGRSGAQQQAATLTSGAGNICQARPSASTQRALARVDALLAQGKKAEAKALLKQTFADLERERKQEKSRRVFIERGVGARAAGGCPDQSGHVSLKIKAVTDNLALAQKALQAKDDALAAKAMDAARAALKAWVQSPENGVSTVGDWLRVQRAAEALGSAQVVNYAAGRSRTQANADVAKAAQVDACTVNRGDYECWARTIATAQLVGSFQDSQLRTAEKLGKAIEDRLNHIAPQGCEEWTFTMTATSVMPHTGDTWNIKWGPGKFRVNRDAGTFDGSYEAGYIPESGWPGIVGSATDACIETVDGREINHGPATITGGAFHYRFEGTVDDNTIELTAPSDDAKVTVTAPPDPGCQFLAVLAEGVLTSMLKGGVPAIFEVTRTQEVATFQYSDADSSMTAQIKRSPLKTP
jgi:hypothetical protein